MAFLDNSGDIILDAVLTDTGRYRLAKADGSFRIVKFAIADDEIDYSLYNSNDLRGSAYYDIEILSTPILEAFTDNMSGLKSKLISLPRNNLMYLPVIKLNELPDGNKRHSTGAFLVAADSTTETKFNNVFSGIFKGVARNGTTMIRLDQGLDTIEIPSTTAIESDLIETQYIVEMDDNLGAVLTPAADNAQSIPASVSYVDDDGIASYFFTLDSDPEHVEELPVPDVNDSDTQSVIAGPRGTSLRFKLGSSLQLQQSTFLFERLGSEVTIGSHTFYYIDTNIKVTGATTGYRVDVPIRFVKWKSTP